MMSYKLILCIACVFLMSCTKTATFEIDSPDPVLVVNAIIGVDSILKVTVSETKSVLDSIIFEPQPNAKVQCKFDNSIISLDEYVPINYELALGYFTNSTITPDEGQTWEIMVSLDDRPDAKATTILPAAPNIGDLEIQAFELTKNTSPFSEDYYVIDGNLSFVLNDDQETENIYGIQASYVADFFERTELSIESPNRIIDSTYRETVFVDEFTIGNSFRPKTFERGLVFTDSLFNGQSKRIDINLSGIMNIREAEPNEVFLEVFSINEDYYKYMKTYNDQLTNLRDPFAEPSSVFNNIEGGFGVFGAYSQVKLRVEL